MLASIALNGSDCRQRRYDGEGHGRAGGASVGMLLGVPQARIVPTAKTTSPGEPGFIVIF
jgi:hypothetical protein